MSRKRHEHYKGTPVTNAALQKAWDFETQWVHPSEARRIERAANAMAGGITEVFRRLPGNLQSILARATKRYFRLRNQAEKPPLRTKRSGTNTQ